MADKNSMLMAGSGGLMRYNEEYKSRFNLSPNYVIALIILVIIVMTVLKIFF